MAVDLARQLLKKFGGLRALLEADLKTFCQTKGLGSAKYVQLQAALEMTRRCLAAELPRGKALTDSQTIRDYVKLRLQSYAREVFACLFLDSRYRVITFEELFSGIILDSPLRVDASGLTLARRPPHPDSCIALRIRFFRAR